ncbi:MAG: hypothetical protein WBQ38_00990, partial [Ignavibacteria bacterium]
MKKLLFITVLLFLINDLSFAVIPQYTMKAENFIQTSANTVEFDINLLHTNSDSSVFEFAAGQYYFNFNAGISNGGGLIYSIVASDLPANLQPVNPIVYLIGGNMQLRLAVNSAPSPGNGYIISDTLQGTRVVRMKLETTAKAFDTQFLNLRWRNGPSNPVTRIYSFVDMAYTEITNSSSHLIDSLQNPLPVELTDFNSSVNANKVNLSWTTASEHNNKGFYIERNFSVNGSNSFEWISIGFIKGSGDLNTVTEYSFQDKDLMTGVYQYRLKQTDYNGLYEYFYLNNEVEILRPVDFKLSQNYPNPF